MSVSRKAPQRGVVHSISSVSWSGLPVPLTEVALSSACCQGPQSSTAQCPGCKLGDLYSAPCCAASHGPHLGPALAGVSGNLPMRVGP